LTLAASARECQVATINLKLQFTRFVFSVKEVEMDKVNNLHKDIANFDKKLIVKSLQLFSFYVGGPNTNGIFHHDL